MRVNIGEIKVRKKVNIGEIKMGVKKVYPELEDLEVTPIAEEQTFKSSKGGFGNVIVKGITSNIDTDIKPENIKEGINILGIDGSYSGIDTSNATATATDLLKDKIAYANGEQITGTIEEYDGSFSGEGSTINELEASFTSAIDNTFGSKTTKLPEEITSIGDYAFYQCKNLALTKLPNKIKSIGSYAFHSCTNLALTSLSSSLTSIADSAFRDCINLSITSLPIGLTVIRNYAFYNCKKLTEITFEGSITLIERNSFYNCGSLAKIVFPNVTTIPRLENTNAFNNTPIASGIGYIYVPDNLVESFKTATNWSTYANQIKAISEMEG